MCSVPSRRRRRCRTANTALCGDQGPLLVHDRLTADWGSAYITANVDRLQCVMNVWYAEPGYSWMTLHIFLFGFLFFSFAAIYSEYE